MLQIGRVKVPQTIKPSRKFSRILLILIGVVLIYFPTAIRSETSRKLQIPTFVAVSGSSHISIDPSLLSNTGLSPAPSRIVVPSVGIDLPVIEAKVTDGLWELSENTASHGIGSAYPGLTGNTVIFAHARDDLFGPLRRIGKNAVIYVFTPDTWYRYSVEEIKLVNPDQTENITATSEEKLTLFTCSGFLDSKRLIIRAVPYKLN